MGARAEHPRREAPRENPAVSQPANFKISSTETTVIIVQVEPDSDAAKFLRLVTALYPELEPYLWAILGDLLDSYADDALKDLDLVRASGNGALDYLDWWKENELAKLEEANPSPKFPVATSKQSKGVGQ